MEEKYATNSKEARTSKSLRGIARSYWTKEKDK